MRLIVGLGNPKEEYQLTRHNLGFLVVEQLAKELKAGFKKSSFIKALVAEVDNQGEAIKLLLPLTYMNNSGQAVKDFFKHRSVSLAEILVICDDMNLEFGQLRLRPKGSAGGHNGLESIIKELATDQFPRLRLGIGQPPSGMDSAQYVLKDFSAQEKKGLTHFILEASECARLWLNQGIDHAMGQCNQRKGHE